MDLGLAFVHSRAAHEAGALPDSQARLLLPRQHIRQNLWKVEKSFVTHFRFIIYKFFPSAIYIEERQENNFVRSGTNWNIGKRICTVFPNWKPDFSTAQRNGISSPRVFTGVSLCFMLKFNHFLSLFYYYYCEGNSDNFLSLFVCRDPVDTLRSVYKYLRDMFSMGHGGQKYWGQTK